MSQERTANLTEFIDNSIVAKFPPGFFQKAQELHGKFTMQIGKNAIYIRSENGRIITWTPSLSKHER